MVVVAFVGSRVVCEVVKAVLVAVSDGLNLTAPPSLLFDDVVVVDCALPLDVAELGRPLDEEVQTTEPAAGGTSYVRKSR